MRGFKMASENFRLRCKNNPALAMARADIQAAYTRCVSAIVGLKRYEPSDDWFRDIVDDRLEALVQRSDMDATPATETAAPRKKVELPDVDAGPGLAGSLDSVTDQMRDDGLTDQGGTGDEPAVDVSDEAAEIERSLSATSFGADPASRKP
jgi:hypothetical protein